MINFLRQQYTNFTSLIMPVLQQLAFLLELKTVQNSFNQNQEMGSHSYQYVLEYILLIL